MKRISKILSVAVLATSLLASTSAFAHGLPDLPDAKTNLIKESFFKIDTKAIDKEIAKGLAKGELTRALILAIENTRDVKLIEYLIKKGADINGSDHIGPKPMHVIAAEGTLKQVKAFFKHKPDVTITDGSKRNALLASLYDQTDLSVVKFMVSQGLDIKNRDTSGRNGILIAAYRNPNLDILKYLYQQGLDLNIVSSDHGDNAIFRATNNKNAVNTINWLSENGVKHNNLNYHDRNIVSYMAQRSGRSKNFELLKSYIAEGISPADKDEDGRDALLNAAYRNDDLNTIKYLAENGADINSLDNAGRNALNIAAYRNKDKVVEFFIQAGLDADAKDEDGNTALIWAAKRNKIGVIKQLIEAGADVGATDKDGLNAIMHVVSREASKKTKKGSIVKIIKLLVAAGAKLDGKTAKNDTALIKAAQNGHHLDTLQYLVENGADVNAVNSYKLTPLMYAAMKTTNVEVLEYLLAKGAKTNNVDDFGDTVVDLVKENELLKSTNAVSIIEKAIK